MPRPLDFTIDVQNPISNVLKGYQAGVLIKEKQAKIRQIESERQQALQMQRDLAQLSDNPNPTSQDFTRMMTKYPQLSNHFSKTWDILDSKQKETRTEQLSQIYSALETENSEIAKNLLEDQRLAAENSGLPEEAKKAEVMLKLIENNPKAAKLSARLALSSVMGPDKFSQTFKTLSEPTGEKVGTFKFNEKVGMINTKTGEVLTSLKELGTPTLDSEKKFDQENKLRKDFNSVTKDFRSVRDAMSRVRSSAIDPSAAGDLALIFNYMKILDPGSTVREGEFATAQNSAGVPEIIRAQYNKIVSGKRLSDAQRNDFVDRSKKLFSRRQGQYRKTSNEYKKLAKRYNLSPENIVLDLDILEEVRNFKSIKEADEAKLPKGTIISINGKKAVVE